MAKNCGQPPFGIVAWYFELLGFPGGLYLLVTASCIHLWGLGPRAHLRNNLAADAAAKEIAVMMPNRTIHRRDSWPKRLVPKVGGSV